MITWATELKVRAERRAGELLKTMPKNPGARGSGSNQHEVRFSKGTTPPTIASQGISKKDSMRWQQLAAVPEEQFEAAIATRKSIGGSLSTAALLSEIPRGQELRAFNRETKRQSLAAAAPMDEVTVPDGPMV